MRVNICFLKKTICISIVFVSFIGLAGCASMSPEERVRADELVRTYSGAFIEQARAQYGYNAEVENIRAQTRGIPDSLWPTADIVTTGNLRGVVTAADESFSAIYLIGENKVISQRNHYKIMDSLNDFFAHLNLDIIHADIYNTNTRSRFFLPDHITSFEGMLKEELSMAVRIYVTNDLCDITEEDFAFILPWWDFRSNAGSIYICQVYDLETVLRVERAIRRGNLSTHHHDMPQIIIGSFGNMVNVFDYLNIRSSISVRYNSRNNNLRFYHISQKNRDKLRESVSDFFGYLNLDIVHITSGGSGDGINISNNITEFEGLLGVLYIYVTNDISNLTKADFAILENIWRNNSATFSTSRFDHRIRFFQVDNQEIAIQLNRRLVRTFMTCDSRFAPRVWGSGGSTSADAFEYFNIYNFIHIGYDSRYGVFEFNSLNYATNN